MTSPTLPEGFLLWTGGPCPVPLDSNVELFCYGGKHGKTAISCDNRAEDVRWWHDPEPKMWNVIGYKPDPDYVAPIDWQDRAEKAEATIQSLTLELDATRDDRRAAEAAGEKLAKALKAFADAYNPDTECETDTLVRYEGVSVRQALGRGDGIFLADYRRSLAALTEWEKR